MVSKLEEKAKAKEERRMQKQPQGKATKTMGKRRDLAGDVAKSTGEANVQL